MFNNRNITSSKAYSVFILEEDAEKMTLLSFEFKRYGFNVHKFSSMETLFQGFELHNPNAVIINLDSLKSKEKIEIIKSCMEIRNLNKPKATTIIFLVDITNLSEYPSTEEGGADEYMSYKSNPKIIVAALKSRMKDTYLSEENSPILSFDDITLNPLSFKVKRAGKEIRLGPTEFRILEYLMRNPTRILNREMIIRAIWDQGIKIEERTIDVHINRLRQALKVSREHENEPPIIVTIRSRGYTLRKTVIA